MGLKRTTFVLISAAMMVALVASGLAGEASKEDSAYKYLSVFSEVFSLVRNAYVDEVDSEKLIDGAFEGVTDAIDEYSYYVSPADMAAHAEIGDDETRGLGLIVSKRLGYAFVIGPVPGSPAAAAGIESGDFIERINGLLTTDMPIWRVRQLLQPRDDKPVELLIVRRGMGEREEFTLQPIEYEVTPPSLEVLDGGVADIRIPYFRPGTGEAFVGLVEKAKGEGASKMILDLRGNAGGSIEEAIRIADELLDKGTITTLEGRRVEQKKWDADRSILFDGPLVVLIDASTASGAEILAAAISGNKRGTVVGVQSFGRAHEQSFIKLSSGGGLNVTVAEYADPTSQLLNARGVKPDVAIHITTMALHESDEKRDLFLDEGLSVLAGDKESVN